LDIGHDPETKPESLQWKSPQSPRAKRGMAGPEFTKEHSLEARGKKKSSVIGIYIPKETILKEMAAKIE
jgi:hypothetical protein